DSDRFRRPPSVRQTAAGAAGRGPRGPLPKRLPRPAPPRSAAGREAERVQLVAVRVAEIRGVEIAEAQARRAFVLGAELERALVDPLHGLRRVARERDHRAVADARGLAVVRLADGEARASLARRPRDDPIRLEASLRAEFRE